MIQRDVADRLLARAGQPHLLVAHRAARGSASRCAARATSRRACSFPCRTCARASCARRRAPTRRSARTSSRRSRRWCAPRSGSAARRSRTRCAAPGCPTRPRPAPRSGIDPRARAETLAPEAFLALARAFAAGVRRSPAPLTSREIPALHFGPARRGIASRDPHPTSRNPPPERGAPGRQKTRLAQPSARSDPSGDRDGGSQQASSRERSPGAREETPRHEHRPRLRMPRPPADVGERKSPSGRRVDRFPVQMRQVGRRTSMSTVTLKSAREHRVTAPSLAEAQEPRRADRDAHRLRLHLRPDLRRRRHRRAARGRLARQRRAGPRHHAARDARRDDLPHAPGRARGVSARSWSRTCRSGRSRSRPKRRCATPCAA